MTDVEFFLEAEQILNYIADTIEDSDSNGDTDIDFNGDILTIINDSGTFVINKQSAAKEIWLSSPISGPHHFAQKNSSWYARSGDTLYEILSRELKIKLTSL
jgi:CyaY protein